MKEYKKMVPKNKFIDTDKAGMINFCKEKLNDGTFRDRALALKKL